MPYPGITFRPISDDDMPFLYEVFVSTRVDELAPLGWTDEQIDAFLRPQFHAQHTHYHAYFKGATYDLIVLDEQAIGRLYLYRTDTELRILDIALLPSHRQQGIGGVLLQDLLDEARAGQKTVGIYVEKFNPALRLYQRLGFREMEDTGVYYRMEWSAEAPSPAQDT
ncbi:MAG: hypothetical protein ETSY1_32160 [Candidatus Entotheonella factor]|uniref:N-acetyltransferase domain-containing protein n=1 Tax=Entotheonella factor TaxID=1429438 RepID=W4LAM9_ENTF1|nr:MAG: hypothetical protein ETSY1_32160 [Candidatus Entotheonella factor]